MQVELSDWCMWQCAYHILTGRCYSSSLAVGSFNYRHVTQVIIITPSIYNLKKRKNKKKHIQSKFMKSVLEEMDYALEMFFSLQWLLEESG